MEQCYNFAENIDRITVPDFGFRKNEMEQS